MPQHPKSGSPSGQPPIRSASELLKALEEDLQGNRLILPSLPEVALRVRQVLERSDCSVPDLAQVISTDAGIAARLIKVANSAAYRGNHPIEDIRSAITRLGLQLVRTLVTQLALLNAMHGYSGWVGQQLKMIAHHSMEVGAYSYALASRYTRLNPEEALLAGLVHDIGKLPLLVRLNNIPGLPPKTIEQALALLHERVGGMVLRAWQFAPDMVAAAEEHEKLRRNPHGEVDYSDVVIIANLFQHWKQRKQMGLPTTSPVVHALSKLGITLEDLLDDTALETQYTQTLQRLVA